MAMFTERERLALEKAERAVLLKHGLLPTNRKELSEMSQAELKKEYERQRKPEVQKEIEIKREMEQKFSNITGKAPQPFGTVQPLYNEKTGEVFYTVRYYAEKKGT